MKDALNQVGEGWNVDLLGLWFNCVVCQRRLEMSVDM